MKAAVDLQVIFDIGVRSQEFNEPPQLLRAGRDTLLSFGFETETGGYDTKTLRFVDAVAYKVTRMPCVEPWVVAAYDAVAVLSNSAWKNEVVRNHTAGYNHYVVFFEDYGCHEFIAQDVSRD